MTNLTDYTRQRQAAYRESRRAWALAHDRPYPENGGLRTGRVPDPEKMKLAAKA